MVIVITATLQSQRRHKELGSNKLQHKKYQNDHSTINPLLGRLSK